MKLTLKKWRLLKELTQDEVAAMCGVHRNTVANWEENPEKMSIKNALAFADVLNINIDDIIFCDKNLQNVE